MKNSIPLNLNLLGSLIDCHLEQLLLEKNKNQQKILELCHVGKFLMFFENTIQIDRISEQPDFLLRNNSETIGLEHQIIIDSKAKEKEGFYENIFTTAELELKGDSLLPNFLANCFLHPELNFKLNQKKELVSMVKEIVKDFVLYNRFTENPLIEDISIMPHSQKSINANFGAWWAKNITAELVETAIKKKNDKITYYQKDGVNSHWLLLVIGGVGDSSYNMDTSLKIDIESPFDKIFILEDFRNNLFELK